LVKLAIGRHDLGRQGISQGKVDAVVGSSTGRQGNPQPGKEQRAHGMNLDVSLLKIASDPLGFRLRQLAAAHFLPEDVARSLLDAARLTWTGLGLPKLSL